ncbi:28S ribosomal protein S21 [Trichuris trichiura]|uniref:28S ribosomal protein S21 n=1 Tax=Trichuris trichiura TaxID=36087 RepID=A0A077Z5R9_TRITR|nr:28S ribosomal protein S21 [Trichuris trichiura]
MVESTETEIPATNGTANRAGSSASPLPNNGNSLDRYGPTIVRFTQFKTATDIPEQFYQRHVRLRGIVNSVNGDGQLLIAHSPILRLPWQKPQPSRLNVRLAGIDLVNGGADWLRHNLSSKAVKFELLKRHEQNILADVFAKRTRWSPLFYNVNQELVRRGLSRIVSFDNEEHLRDVQLIPRYGRLIQRLLISEHYADKRGIGYWKRPNAIEAMASYSVQTTEMIKHSNVATLFNLLYRQTKALSLVLLTTCRRMLPFVFRGLRVAFDSAKRTVTLLWRLVQSKRADLYYMPSLMSNVQHRRHFASMYHAQPFGHRLFRGIVKAHPRVLNRTVLVKNNDVETAMKLLNRNMAAEGLLDIYRRTRYYEKPYQQRNRLSYEICKAIYNEDMRRKIALVTRKNRADRWPGQY